MSVIWSNISIITTTKALPVISCVSLALIVGFLPSWYSPSCGNVYQLLCIWITTFPEDAPGFVTYLIVWDPSHLPAWPQLMFQSGGELVSQRRWSYIALLTGHQWSLSERWVYCWVSAELPTSCHVGTRCLPFQSDERTCEKAGSCSSTLWTIACLEPHLVGHSILSLRSGSLSFFGASASFFFCFKV